MTTWTQVGATSTYRYRCGDLSVTLEYTAVDDWNPWEWWADIDTEGGPLQFEGKCPNEEKDVDGAKIEALTDIVLCIQGVRDSFDTLANTVMGVDG